MAKVSAQLAINFTKVAFPTITEADYIIYTNANVLEFGDKSGLWFKFFGPFSGSSAADDVTKITMLNAHNQVIFTISGLEQWEYELPLTFNGNTANALSSLFVLDDDITLSSANDVINAYEGNDTVRGGAGDDRLLGGIDADRLIGGAGADSLLGGSGRDMLSGGQGHDQLTGGTGADRFVFNTAPLAANSDQILDFKAVDDVVVLENANFTALGYTGQIHAENFVLGSSARDANDFVIYKKSTGSLWYDANGSTLGGKVLIADLADGTTLTAADIFLI